MCTTRRHLLFLPSFLLLLSLVGCGPPLDLDVPPRGDTHAPPLTYPDSSTPPPPTDLGLPPATDLGAAVDDESPGPTCQGLGPPAKRDFTLTLTHGVLKRTALVHLPPGYDGSKPIPLVFNNHGSMSSATHQAKMSHLNLHADGVGAMTVTPQGTGLIAGWNVGNAPMGYLYDKVDDVGFFKAMLVELKKTVCIDEKRIHCAGFSLGGSMCYRLSCDAADQIASIVSVSGPDGTKTCSPARPVPLLHIHGTADTFASYSPDPNGGANKGAEVYVANHATRSGCTSQTQVTLTQGKVSCKSFGCPVGVEVTLCTVEGGGHTWPGGDGWFLGGTVNKDITASQMALQFFANYPLP
jgi:polyhydroxybutyrate depolymerase